MSAGYRPPRLAMLLLRLAVRGPAAEFIVGDLVEEYEQRSRGGEDRRVRGWFWRQTLATVAATLFRGGASRGGASRRSGSGAGSPADLRVAGAGVRGRRGASVSWLDVKLGVRMLAKYPGLSLVSVVGMAVAVAIGAGAFGSIHGWMNSELPLPGGDRLVFIETRDVREYDRPYRQILHDFLLWRDAVASVPELAAYGDVTRNLIAADGGTELVRVAEMTASGFRIARVQPVLGRPLLEDDERPDAQPVVVIAWDEWQRRFQGDPAVLGRPLRLGAEVHTIVGVMPEGFRFPVNYRFWVPLRVNPSDYAWGTGPSLRVFGRLAEGATLEQAQAELATIGAATAAAYPETHEHLRPQVMPYPLAFVDVDSPQQAWIFRAIPLAVALLLVVVAVNVGILVYARTATRLGEIAVRSALGASRRRIVAQLFVEALVLAVVAAAAGLAVAGVGLDRTGDWMRRVSPDRIPYWWDFGLTPGLVAYVGGLAVVAGVIVGVVPGLKATSGGVQAGLQHAGRGARLQLGRLWTALIVAQVAIAVAVLPFTVFVTGAAVQRGTTVPGYPAEELLRARLSMEREPRPSGATAEDDEALRARFVDRAGQLVRRLEAEPAVPGVSFATHFPGGGREARIEVEGAGTVQVRVAGVHPDLFRVIGVPILTGREFVQADTREGAGTVIVDRLFVEEVLGGGAVLGRRIRQLGRAPGGAPGELEPGPWLEVVGVVREFGVPLAFEGALPMLYEPMDLTSAFSPTLVVRTRGRASDFAGRLRDMASAVDPTLQLGELHTAAGYQGIGQQVMRLVAFTMVAVTLSVLLLSAAGIYAMLSFTVARRRREIGIRSALGAAPQRLLRAVFARAGAQLGVGVLAGLLLAAALDRAAGGGPLVGRGMLLLAAVAALMMSVGLLAAYGPARRGLAVQPTEALREE